MAEQVEDWARPVVHFQIRGRDSKRLQDFYARLFNWKIEAGPAGNFLVIEHGVGGPPEGVGGSIASAEAPAITVFVQVRDLRESLEVAERLGGKKLLDPIDVPGGPTIAQIADPEGNTIGLVKQ